MVAMVAMVAIANLRLITITSQESKYNI